MLSPSVNELSRREREVLYIVYELGEVSVSEVQSALSDASYNAVRRILDSVSKKGLIKYKRIGRRFIYSPARSRVEEGTVALKEVLNTFFSGSAALGFMNVLKNKDQQLRELEIQNVRQLLEELGGHDDPES